MVLQRPGIYLLFLVTCQDQHRNILNKQHEYNPAAGKLLWYPALHGYFQYLCGESITPDRRKGRDK